MGEGRLVDICADEYDEASGCEPMLLFWYVQVGDRVVEGQDLCEVESAKAVVGFCAPVSGVVSEILVHETEAVASGQVLARIQAEGND
jgi:2-oxoisovalerate dehydrogenase E2 component (dihydrolipoyl transacylase)